VTAIAVNEAIATESVARRFDLSIETTRRFFGENVDAISTTCFEMARRFERGGRLIVFGTGAAATDAQHVSVEFIHPVIVGKRALPAIALTSDVASVTARDRIGGFHSMLATLAREEDIVLGLLGDADQRDIVDALEVAKKRGLLTISIGPGQSNAGREHSYRIPTNDPFVAQEVSETLYHVFWELVHLFLEHLPANPGGTPS